MEEVVAAVVVAKVESDEKGYAKTEQVGHVTALVLPE
jgi:hypothetical protein